MKVVVNCKTKEEWDDVTAVLGYKWSESTSWDFFKEDTCINLHDVFYGSIVSYTNDKYKILSFNDWLKTLDRPIRTDTEIDEDLSYLIELFKKLNIE